MNESVVNKEDYESYDLILPVSMLGKKEKGYLYRELEKLHPCFSENSCVDYKKYISHGKLRARIVVMDKNKLAGYKKNVTGGLYLENNRRRKFFTNIRVKERMILWGSVSFALVLASLIIGIGLNGRNSNEGMKNERSLEKSSELIEKSMNYEVLETQIMNSVNTSLIFSNAELIGLDYERYGTYGNGRTGILLSVKGCYPESLKLQKKEGVEISYGPIIYNENEKSFDVSIDYDMTDSTLPESDGMDLQILSQIRSLIINHGGNLISENASACELSFEIGGLTIKDFAFEMEEFLSKNNIGVLKMNVSMQKTMTENEPLVRLNMTYARNMGNAFVLRMLHSLKVSESSKHVEKNVRQESVIHGESSVIKNVQVPEANNLILTGEQIGIISRPDGRKILYLKMDDGSIKEVYK